MNKRPLHRAIFLMTVLAYSSGCGNVAANLSPQTSPAQPLQQTQPEQQAQVFTLTTSSAATYSSPSGALEPMPATSLALETHAPGLLTISFSARGSVAPSGSQIIPIVFIECRIDSLACQPDTNTVEFLYPQFCCDTRSFNWVAQNVPAGSHTVEILWGMGNPTSAIVTNRSLIIESATP
jgi:hypothetical protein